MATAHEMNVDKYMCNLFYLLKSLLLVYVQLYNQSYLILIQGCKWAFTCQQKLSRHMVRHTGDRKYQCTFEGCNKLFTRLEHLKGHKVSHSGEKPYACSEPGKKELYSLAIFSTSMTAFYPVVIIVCL